MDGADARGATLGLEAGNVCSSPAYVPIPRDMYKRNLTSANFRKALVLAGLSPCLLCGLSFRNEGHDSTPIGALFPLEGRNNGLEIVAVLLRNGCPVSADFIHDGVL